MNRRELDRLKRRIETHQGRRATTLATLAGTPYCQPDSPLRDGELGLLRRMIVRRLGPEASREIVERLDVMIAAMRRLNGEERALLLELWQAVNDLEKRNQTSRLPGGDLLTQLGLKL